MENEARELRNYRVHFLDGAFIEFKADWCESMNEEGEKYFYIKDEVRIVIAAGTWKWIQTFNEDL